MSINITNDEYEALIRERMLKARVSVLERQVRFVMKVLWTTEATSFNMSRFEKEYWPEAEDEDDGERNQEV